MNEPVRSLPVHPPRPYGIKDAYNRRVWRSPGVVFGRELFFFGLVFAGLGVANTLPNMVFAGWGLLILGGLAALFSSVITNLRRTYLVRDGHVTDGVLQGTTRVPLLHEMFRQERERT